MKRTVKLTKNIQTNPISTIKDIVENEEPTKVLYEQSKQYITYQVIVDDDLDENSELYKAALGKDLFEYPLENFKSIFEMFHLINSKGMFISHILVGDIKAFSKFLQKPDIKQLFNINLIQVEDLESDVVLFIASTQRQAETVDFRFVVKGNINA